MNTITAEDGTEIYYKDWGEGPVVTFSHGWPLSSDAWDRTATARSPHIHTHKGRTGTADWNLIQTDYFVDRLERRPEG